MIDNLRYAKVFEREEFMNKPITHGPLLNGRHRCNFEFILGDCNIKVKGVQYEVDSCYESEENILLNECKNEAKNIKEFNIRQLYYPYCEIIKSTNKKIIPIFIHKVNDIIHIWTYSFPDINKMNIKLEKHNVYKFKED